MTTMKSEVYDVLRSVDVPRDEAMRAAVEVNRRDDDLRAVKTDITLLKWMMALMLAVQFAILLALVGG